MEHSAVQNVEDLFTRLLLMGFEESDCEEAISSGLLSVECAIEWILNGKPKQDRNPTLLLRKNNDSGFDSTVGTVEVATVEKESAEFGSDSCSNRLDEVKVVSQRRTEKQREGWDEFHEKERRRAHCEAERERHEKEKNLAFVLKQIELDRRDRRSQTVANDEHTDDRQSKLGFPKQPSSRTDDSNTTIKLRCLDGSTLTRTYNKRDKLSKLWDDVGIVASNDSEAGTITLIQPFPKHEFSERDFDRTFEDFNLFPSGSLVLQIVSFSKGRESPPVPENDRNEPVPIRDVVAEQRRVPNVMAELLDEEAGFGHIWGDGQPLGADRDRLRPLENLVVCDRNIGLDRWDLSERPILSSSVRPLSDISMQRVIERLADPALCSTRPKLPASLAERIVQTMIKEHVLTPLTLQMFISCHLNKVNLDFYPYATNELLHSLRLHAAVQHISLVSCSLISDAGLYNLTNFRRLHSLNLRGCSQITDNGLLAMRDFPCLTSLNLDSSKITDLGIESYVRNGSRTLQHLNLNRTLITDAALKSISCLTNLKSLFLDETRVICLKELRNLAHLETLSLRAVPLVPSSLADLDSVPRLGSLNLSELTTVDGDAALRIIKNLKLKRLRLPSRLTTTDIGMAHISGMPLRELDLTNYVHLTDHGLRDVGRIHSLRVLLLSNTKVSDVGLLCLDRLTDLEVLYLDRTLITDAGTSVFRGMTKLVELSLASTRVSIKAGTLNFCLLLNKLNLSFTRVSDKGLKQLTLPDVTLVSVDGTRLRADPTVLLERCPRLRHVSAKNVIPRGSYDSSDDDD